MREIKYRVYDNCDDDPLGMCPVHSIFWHSGTQYVSWASGTCEALITDVPVMQYTGLKDCNGVEIYEGDVLLWHGMDGERNEHEPWVVVWSGEDDAACFELLEPVSRATNNQFQWPYLEVIGNIHENPELLGRE